ncbi:OLC1v1006421C1 [Oldenlandia corymbosa var. corymbosa]|uniref:OLC1v1006421C1 n=1 Tax=Oldenlandia corymbosa var. corymbosa TaxID=529605 RepID=A0AAV1DJC0_OLDCO|nr:OLC1v1006421C1 [Oldenlandia corymbosa var. corymbosa]
MAAVAARSMMRSATASARSASSKAFAGAKPKAAPSPFRTPVQNPLTARIFRSPVELSSVSVNSMFPYHTATASALLTSMLSDSARTYGWTLEGKERTS